MAIKTLHNLWKGFDSYNVVYGGAVQQVTVSDQGRTVKGNTLIPCPSWFSQQMGTYLLKPNSNTQENKLWIPKIYKLPIDMYTPETPGLINLSTGSSGNVQIISDNGTTTARNLNGLCTLAEGAYEAYGDKYARVSHFGTGAVSIYMEHDPNIAQTEFKAAITYNGNLTTSQFNDYYVYNHENPNTSNATELLSPNPVNWKIDANLGDYKITLNDSLNGSRLVNFGLNNKNEFVIVKTGGTRPGTSGPFTNDGIYPFNLINSVVPNSNYATKIMTNTIAQNYTNIFQNNANIALRSNVTNNEAILACNIPRIDLLPLFNGKDKIMFVLSSPVTLDLAIAGFSSDTVRTPSFLTQQTGTTFITTLTRQQADSVQNGYVQIILSTPASTNISSTSQIKLNAVTNLIDPIIDELMPIMQDEVLLNNININSILKGSLYDITTDYSNSISTTSNMNKSNVSSLLLDSNKIDIKFLSDMSDFNEITENVELLYNTFKKTAKLKLGVLPNKIIEVVLKNIDTEPHDNYSWITLEFEKLQRTSYNHYDIKNIVGNKFNVPNNQREASMIKIEGSGSSIDLRIDDDDGSQKMKINQSFSNNVIIDSIENKIYIDGIQVSNQALTYTSEFFELKGNCTATLNAGAVKRVII